MIKTEISGGPLSGDYAHSGSLVNSRLLGPSRPPTSTPGAISPSHLNGNREGKYVYFAPMNMLNNNWFQ